MSSAVLANALAGTVKGGGSAKAVTDKAKKGAFATAVGASPAVQQIVSLIIDALDAIISAEIGFDLPNGQQTFDFLDNCVVNWNSIAYQALSYPSEGHSYAGQGFAIALFELAEPLPCSSRLALTYWCRKGLHEAMKLTGKKAGTLSVKYWESRYNKLIAGDKVEFYSQFDKNGKGKPASLRTCQLGFGGTSKQTTPASAEIAVINAQIKELVEKIGKTGGSAKDWAKLAELDEKKMKLGAAGIRLSNVQATSDSIDKFLAKKPSSSTTTPAQQAAIGAGALLLLSRLAG